MTGSQALMRSLVREGVELIFGLPGIQIHDAFDALYHESSIRLVLVRHEQATAYMADGYARTTGRAGVALVVPGPGALNASAALGTAYATSSPVLLISGQTESKHLGKRRGALHEIDDQLDVFRPITKWCSRATKSEDIPQLVRTAMRNLYTGRPRPVEIEIPWDVLPASADTTLLDPEEFLGQAPDPAKTKEAAELLAQAKYPLIWVGGGGREADLSTELLELAQALNAPVITTPQGKGVISEDHPLSLGSFCFGHDAAALALPRADVILAVGTRLFPSSTVRGTVQPHQKLIRIDADSEEVDRNFQPDIGITADGRLGLLGLLADIGGKTRSSQWIEGEISALRQLSYQEMNDAAPSQMRIINTIRQELDDDAIVVSGITEIGYWSHGAFPVRRPRSYITAGYFATLGFAFPTALGAKVGNPNRQVVAISGDGGFMFAASELASAVQEGINLVTLVFNNGTLGASFADQKHNFGGRVFGTKLHNPDFVKLAEAHGALGMKVSGPDELGEALNSALRAQRPVVIEVSIPNLGPPFHIPPRPRA
jgi:acetolactate synthase-1/2/3 large subunit